MFTKVLIANRGAIACRVIRTLKKMGVSSVAVYSEADAHSLHVAQADEAVCIGAAPATESYLNFDKILGAAKATGAEAIHPGYGFLSENAEFAEACAFAGIVFIGPTPQQMRDFGLKHTARALAQLNGVPMLPGSELLSDLSIAKSEANRIGYPVMLKSTAGGGGIGMRVCADEAGLIDAFESVKRMAVSAFKQSGVFLEKYVSTARHIEVQIFGDGKGHVVALGERDCSAQRRNQKVVEETPAPGLTAELRAELLATATRLASAVGYQSAGTVEYVFDVASLSFYFLEVNTRLQVEHGVTEEVTGVDLVAWMVQAAAGELDLTDYVRNTNIGGCSIQVRLYAEDPHKNFQPSSGVLTAAEFPSGARVETWVERGSDIPSFYDPMIAKIIVTAADRPSALAKLAVALAETKVAGIECNLDYLRQITASAEFAAGDVHTQWLATFPYKPATIDVIEPGTQTSVQDYPGRVGYWSIGVPPSGPMDDYAFRLANRLVGNPDDAAGLEITLAGPTLRFNLDTTVALCGAAFESDLDGNPFPLWTAVHVRAGSTLRIRTINGAGCRASLAVRGGFDVPAYLGSKSTFALGKFGGHAGRVLRHGDVLPVGRVDEPFAPVLVAPASLVTEYGAHWEISVLYGPHAAPDFFTEEFIDTFFATDWKVHYNSNRLGIRLIGPKPSFARPDGGEAGLHPSNIHDTEYAIGTINFTGDMPVILAKDGPSLGGFVCPATIIQSDLWKVGQLCPGDTIRFVRTTFAEALLAEKRVDAAIAELGEMESGIGIPACAVEGQTQAGMPVPLSAILRTLPASDTCPGVVYRQAGDKYILIEYGPLILDLEFRFRVHALMEWCKAHSIPGVIELSPGVRSLQVNFDSRKIALDTLLDTLVKAESELPPVADMEVPTRVVRMPLAFDADTTRAAIAKYQQSVRANAPWLPSNIEFMRRMNGLDSIDVVRDTIFNASYLVLGLGDVYLGAPCAVPVDPRHRMQTTKYNPARTWTAEGEVGIGGVYMCVYGMESPGGYQLVGRTVPVWNTYKRTKEFQPDQPWLLRFFDQVRFYPMMEKDLNEFRVAFHRGQVSLDITKEPFSVKNYREFLARESVDISAFKAVQQAAFDEERERWARDGSAEIPPPPESPAGQDESEVIVPEGGMLVASSISGNVWAVPVKVGDVVEAGQKIAIIEAMKMEVPVEAPVAGVVERIVAPPGKLVSSGQPLIVLAPVSAAAVPDQPQSERVGDNPFHLASTMPLRSLDLHSLQASFSAGLTPEALVDDIHERIAARGDDHVWIHLSPVSEARAAAAAQRARLEAGDKLPLYGVPFAVKDNIDVAGMPTTAACREFAYTPDKSATVVAALLEAGAVCIGKTNLDQFATGLVGTRSPYGAPSCVFNADYISGGSSSGSAVSVAAGLVSFSLGTDTAGSGRVPAGFNNLVGWKPTKGLLSTTGLVPACRSLDCISVFALTCADAQIIGGIVSKFDPTDAYSRRAPENTGDFSPGFRFGVPPSDQLEFFGDTAAAALFEKSAARLTALGGVRVEIDFAPFKETAELLYSGPWVAERLSAVQEFREKCPDALYPTTEKIIAGGANYDAVMTFRSLYRLEELRRVAETEWTKMDVLLLPTSGTIYSHAQLEEEPVQYNTNLGYYTNFVNLLDLSGLALPAGFRANGLPFGVTLLAPAFRDSALWVLGGHYHSTLGGKLGGTDMSLDDLPEPTPTPVKTVQLAVVGAHLSGMPLNHQLTSRGATLVKKTRTAGNYRFYALPGTTPPKPGLVLDPEARGEGIEVEVWSLSEAAFGQFTAEVPQPLAIGTLVLKDGSKLKGFVCEPAAIFEATEITQFGGWRAYLASLKA